MTIIFDFNRTIFDPETGSLVSGALSALNHFYTKGYALHLVSKREGGREDFLDTLELRHFFKTISFVSDKSEPIARIFAESPGPVYVVGDYLESEIRAGNRVGAVTVWYRQGRFAKFAPVSAEDMPTHTITDMAELLSLIP